MDRSRGVLCSLCQMSKCKRKTEKKQQDFWPRPYLPSLDLWAFQCVGSSFVFAWKPRNVWTHKKNFVYTWNFIKFNVPYRLSACMLSQLPATFPLTPQGLLGLRGLPFIFFGQSLSDTRGYTTFEHDCMTRFGSWRRRRKRKENRKNNRNKNCREEKKSIWRKRRRKKPKRNK